MAVLAALAFEIDATVLADYVLLLGQDLVDQELLFGFKVQMAAFALLVFWVEDLVLDHLLFGVEEQLTGFIGALDLFGGSRARRRHLAGFRSQNLEAWFKINRSGRRRW